MVNRSLFTFLLVVFTFIIKIKPHFWQKLWPKLQQQEPRCNAEELSFKPDIWRLPHLCQCYHYLHLKATSKACILSLHDWSHKLTKVEVQDWIEHPFPLSFQPLVRRRSGFRLITMEIADVCVWRASVLIAEGLKLLWETWRASNHRRNLVLLKLLNRHKELVHYRRNAYCHFSRSAHHWIK